MERRRRMAVVSFAIDDHLNVEGINVFELLFVKGRVQIIL